MRPFVFALFFIAAVNCEDAFGRASSETATEVVASIFDACLQYGSISCVKPKVLRFLSSAIKKDEIGLTENLSIVRSGPADWDDEVGQLRLCSFWESFYRPLILEFEED